MSIGDKPVNAVFNNEGATSLISFNKSDLNQNGLTYREWLIGMLASNPALTSDGYGINLNKEDNAQNIILQADTIIKQLDKEVK